MRKMNIRLGKELGGRTSRPPAEQAAIAQQLLEHHWRALNHLTRNHWFEEHLVRNALRRTNPKLLRLALESSDDMDRVRLIDAVRPSVQEQLGSGLAARLGVVLVTYDDALSCLDPREDSQKLKRLRKKIANSKMPEGPLLVITYPGITIEYVEIVAGPQAGRILRMEAPSMVPILVRPSDSLDVLVRVCVSPSEEGTS